MFFNPIFVITVFLLEIISLAVFSKLLLNSLARFFHSITKSYRATIIWLAVLFFPGTLIHELSHAVAAGVLFVPVGEIEFIPEIREDHVKLGSAQIGKTDLFRRMIIGLAPVLIGTLILIAPIYFFINSDFKISLWLWGLLLYVVFQVSNTMFSSKKDLEGSLSALIVIASFFLALYLTGFTKPFVLLGQLFNSKALEAALNINLILLIPIILDLSIYLLVKLTFPKKY